MITAACILLGISAFALVFAVFFGRPSKDEPMEETKCVELDEFETFWTKQENV